MSLRLHPIIEQLATLRVAQGLSQQDIADGTGRTRSAVAAWETGRRLPPLPFIEAYAGVLGYALTLTEAAPAIRCTCCRHLKPAADFDPAARRRGISDFRCAACRATPDRKERAA
jgi:transcriptional regulator with XRE-family HTH domain